MGVAPHHCAVVEDSPAGIEGAARAGMAALGYTAMMPADRLVDAGATATFSNMAELPDLIAGW